MLFCSRSSLLASLFTLASVVLLSGILAPCLSSPLLTRTRHLLDFPHPGLVQQQAQKAQATVQQTAQKVQAAVKKQTEQAKAAVQQQAQKAETTFHQATEKAQAAVQKQTHKAEDTISHTVSSVSQAASAAQQKREATRDHNVQVAKDKIQSTLGEATGKLGGMLPSGGRLMLRRTLSSFGDLKSYFSDLMGGGQARNGLPPGTPQIIMATPPSAPAASSAQGPPAASAQDADPAPAPAPAPGAVPVDQVGLAAAGGDGSNDGGIQVVTSNPISLSNPIDLKGGNYNGNLDTALGK